MSNDLVEPTTDDEAIKAKTTPAQARAYERAVADYIATLEPGASVTWNFKRTGVISGRTRQVDVYIEGTYASMPIKIAVECKHYTNTIGIGMIDEFHGKLADLGIGMGMFYSIGQLSAGAIARADGATTPLIVRHQMEFTALIQPTWVQINDRLISKFGDCGNENCLLGDVEWREWPAGASSERMVAGQCGSCGTWNFRCPHCENEDSFDGERVHCFACSARWRAHYDDFELDSFEELSGPAA